MVEKIMQLGADILDKEGTGVESTLYIFVPSLMSDQVWFGAPAQPLDTDPRPPSSKVRNMPETIGQENNCGFSFAGAGHLRKHERILRIMTEEVAAVADG